MTASGLPDSTNSHQNYPSMSTGGNGDAQREDSPELLRWRADILMDEMMLGAVDVAAGQASQANTPAAGVADAANLAGTEPSHASADHRRGYGDRSDARKSDSGESDSDESDEGGEWWRNPFVAEPVRAGDAQPYSAASNLNLPTWSSFLEREEASSPAEAAILDEVQPLASDSAAPGKPSTPEYARPETQMYADGMLRQPSAMRTVTDERETPGETKRAPWREHDEYADSARRAKRTNLLPRMSVVESTVLLREIDEMRNEIGSVVPETHEWSVRSRHLLGKAETILRHDPERTAEVEYYLNQVRSILERVRQTYRWSQAYYRQLHFYLRAWIAFAAVVLAGALLYRQRLAEFYTFLFNASADSFWAQNTWVWISVLAAGALGGALGALLNMQRFKQTDHGFLDRKYSLRGLLLPIMAAVVGLIIYAPFALISYFLNPTGIIVLILALLPVALAFAYGFFQESFYGTQT